MLFRDALKLRRELNAGSAGRGRAERGCRLLQPVGEAIFGESPRAGASRPQLAQLVVQPDGACSTASATSFSASASASSSGFHDRMPSSAAVHLLSGKTSC